MIVVRFAALTFAVVLAYILIAKNDMEAIIVPLLLTTAHLILRIIAAGPLRLFHWCSAVFRRCNPYARTILHTSFTE